MKMEQSYEENNKGMLSRSDMIREARKSFYGQGHSGFSLFTFSQPKFRERDEEEGEYFAERDGEIFADTLKPRIIITTVLFLALFILCQFNAVPGLFDSLSKLIADNQIVENIYDKAGTWLSVFKQL